MGRRRGIEAQPEQRPAFGYVRVSTEEQASVGVSLEAQRARIEAHCEHHGLDLTTTYADEGRSGKRADTRPGLQDALRAASAARGALVVYALSRLARSTRDAIDIADQLDKAGADLVSITERIDTTTGLGRFFFTTMAALAQLERDLISERTIEAMAHKRRLGQRISGKIPFGCDLAEDGCRLVPNEEEQQSLRLIRRLRDEGLSSRAIIRRLEAEGIEAKGGGRWHPKVVLAIVGAQR